MKIISEREIVLIDTKDILEISYDFVGEKLYAVVARGEAKGSVTLSEDIDEDEARTIIREIVQYEINNYKSYVIPKRKADE